MNRLALCCLASLTLASGGCSSSKKPKPNPAIATQTEADFMERWVQKRIGELMASGTATDALQARRMAQEEFRKQWPYAVPTKP